MLRSLWETRVRAVTHLDVAARNESATKRIGEMLSTARSGSMFLPSTVLQRQKTKPRP